MTTVLCSGCCSSTGRGDLPLIINRISYEVIDTHTCESTLKEICNNLISIFFFFFFMTMYHRKKSYQSSPVTHTTDQWRHFTHQSVAHIIAGLNLRFTNSAVPVSISTSWRARSKKRKDFHTHRIDSMNRCRQHFCQLNTVYILTKRIRESLAPTVKKKKSIMFL